MQAEQNILRVYHQAGSGEVDAGLRWYLFANEEASRIGHGLNIGISSAVIAALSPGLRWERNIEAAERIIKGEELDGLGVRWYDGVRKAKRILDGENPADVLKGNKVLSFWDNIANPRKSEKVTIDGHAWAIYAGERRSLDEVPTLSDPLYREIEACYQDAADVVGIRPLQLQAITWCVWRRLHHVSSAHYLPLFEEN